MIYINFIISLFNLLILCLIAYIVYAFYKRFDSFFLAAFQITSPPSNSETYAKPMTPEEKNDFLEADKEMTTSFMEAIKTFNEFMTGEEYDTDVGKQEEQS